MPNGSKSKNTTSNSKPAHQNWPDNLLNFLVHRLQPCTSLPVLFIHYRAPVALATANLSAFPPLIACSTGIVINPGFMRHHSAFPCPKNLQSSFIFILFCRPRSYSVSTWSPRGCVDASSRLINCSHHLYLFVRAVDLHGQTPARTDNTCMDGLKICNPSSPVRRPAAYYCRIATTIHQLLQLTCMCVCLIVCVTKLY